MATFKTLPAGAMRGDYRDLYPILDKDNLPIGFSSAQGDNFVANLATDPLTGVVTISDGQGGTLSLGSSAWGITRTTPMEYPILLASGGPTIALSASGAATSLAGTVIQTPNTSPLFQYSLNTSVVSGQLSPNSNGGAKVSFVTDSPDFEVQFNSAGGGSAVFNIMCNGQWLSPTNYNPAFGTGRLRVTYGTRAPRLFTLTGNIAGGNVFFSGVSTVSTDSLSYPTLKSAEKWAVCGDSYVQGGNGGVPSNGARGLGQIVTETLGIESYICYGISGSGYSVGGNSWTTLIDTILPLAPTRFLFLLGTNDTGSTVAVNTANAGAVFDKIHAALPAAKIIAVTTMMTNANGTADNSTLGTIAAAVGRPWVSVISAFANKYVTGTGREGTLANNGNGDIIRSSDGVHPSSYGYPYLGLRIAQDILNLRGMTS